MPNDSLLSQTKQWLEQERAWDDSAYAESRPMIASKSAAAAPVSHAPSMPVATSVDKKSALAALYETYKDCTRCSLGNTRIKFVFGVGNPEARVLFIGEGPGYQEDRQGEPFVGPAGQLLDKILAAIQLDRSRVYIANIVKCHPMVNPQTPEARGNDRPPTPAEVETCAPILLHQISIIRPRIIVTLGSPSTRMILKTNEGITKLRGGFLPLPSHRPAFDHPNLNGIDWDALLQIRVLPTYHPAALLRNPDLKRDTWEDMKLLRDTLASPS